jgi:hypothetical protein
VLGGVSTVFATLLSGVLAALFVANPPVAQWGLIIYGGLVGALVFVPVSALLGFLGGAISGVKTRRGTPQDNSATGRPHSIDRANVNAAADHPMPMQRPLAAKLWRVAKYVAAIGVLIFAGLFVIGWYVTNTKTVAARNSLLVQSLDRAERENGDVLQLLVNGLPTASDADAKQVVTWLSARQFRGELPYLYLLGFYDVKSNDHVRQDEGIEFLAIAMLVYRIDSAKCGDPTAVQAIPILEGAMGVKAMRDAIKAKPESRRSIIEKALEYEAKNRDRQRPEWVCAHGIRSGPPPSDESLEKHRQEMRAQFETSF